jgi:hypothetical protein
VIAERLGILSLPDDLGQAVRLVRFRFLKHWGDS